MPGKVIFDVSGSTSDFVLEKSEIADFVVEARNVTATSPTSSVQVEIDSLSSGAVVFSADDSTIDGYALITDPALGSEELDNAAVVVNN